MKKYFFLPVGITDPYPSRIYLYPLPSIHSNVVDVILMSLLLFLNRLRTFSSVSVVKFKQINVCCEVFQCAFCELFWKMYSFLYENLVFKNIQAQISQNFMNTFRTSCRSINHIFRSKRILQLYKSPQKYFDVSDIKIDTSSFRTGNKNV